MKKFLILAAVAAFAAAPAMATEMTPEQMQMKVDAKFAKADTDANGMMSKAEWTAQSDSMFTEADTNNDGSVSKDEKMAVMKKEMDEDKAMTMKK